ncbi:hypothetical protein I312_104365 [Cryptococcus bacillisporus CA1280]|uniref:Solute carrier family 35 (UDP-xylose/UDP-N-acetylglucosamine transporter), member B4 n=1 Tax=Cryptococcus bacillisporus CA1280 TaxID=1296109 RepID=A0A0D0VHF6_CRYGA|nr:solute carrier family 35 (UDP-xylose/UDP-N-acetylglucosamine transporter), member B4 [Cryptococcus bacillisporus CA1280]
MTDPGLISSFLQTTAGEWFMILFLVFGGCCSNVWALEGVLKDHPKSGTFLTFSQFVFVALQNLSSQVELARSKSGVIYPKLKTRNVPLKRWIIQVILFFAVSLMNNYAFGLKIPVTLHIIFRSGGLCVSMIVGRVIGKRRYSIAQMLAGLLITIGIIIATLSAPHRQSPRSSDTVSSTAESTGQPTSWMAHERDYLAGIAILAGALFLSAFLGLYQEHTYRMYGKQWKEALFYGHFLSLPLFTPFYSDLIQTYNAYTSSPSLTLLSIPRPSASLFPALFTETPISFSSAKYFDWHELLIPSAMFALALNLITQGLCVRGVNRLTTRVNSVTVNMVLTVRKAVSLVISVWYYGSGVTWSLVIGGGMVLLGTILYSLAPGPKGLGPSSSDRDKPIPTPKTKTSSRPRPILVEQKKGEGDDIGDRWEDAEITKARNDSNLQSDPLVSAGLRYRQSPREGSAMEKNATKSR